MTESLIFLSEDKISKFSLDISWINDCENILSLRIELVKIKF